MIEFIKVYTRKFKSGLDYYYRSKNSPYFDSIKIYYDDGTALSLSDLEKGLCANVSLWKYDTTPWVLEVNTKSFIWINRKDVYLTGDLDTDMELVENTLNELLTESPNAYTEFEESKFEFEKHNHKLNDGSEIINSLKENNMKTNIKSSKDSDLNILVDYLDDNWGNESQRDIFKKFKQEHPETSLEFIDFVKYQNDYDVNDDTPYEYEDENGNLYSWEMIEKELTDWVNSGEFEKQFGKDVLDEYRNSDGSYNYNALYDDFWDISSNGAMSYIGSSNRRNNMKKNIKSSNGNWEYQSDDMDEVENEIGDIGISFTEPLLLADDGTIYTRTGFNEWLKYLEKEYGDNWYDAYENYHCDSDEEFIKMCNESYFHHDFGHTLTLYKQGLKDIAESIAKEIPSNKPAFAIPSGFAFELYPEEEEPSGFNSYWIDDLQLNSDSFVWGINPSLGNRFDVAIVPDYLWNGNENITSNRRNDMKKNIKSSYEYVWEVGEKRNIPFENVKDVFEGYGYGEEEADDFWNSKMSDVSDTWDSFPELKKMFGWKTVKSSHQIKSGRFIKSGAGAGYDVTIEGIELDTQNYKVISDEIVDEQYNEHNTLVEVPVKPCSVEWEAEDYYNRVSSEDGIELDGIQVMEYFDDDKRVDGGKATLKLIWYQTDSNEFNNQGEFTDIETACDYCIPDTISIKSLFSAGWIHSDLPTEQIHFEDEYHGYGLDIGEVYYYETMSVDLVAPNISEDINWFFAHDHELEKIFFDNEEDYGDDEIESSRKSKKSKHPDEVAKDNGADITCSHKPIKSGMSYQDALVGFTSMGKPWGDYWEMQQDWAAYVDSLERDGDVDYEEAKNWDNPCTPQTFKEWINE